MKALRYFIQMTLLVSFISSCNGRIRVLTIPPRTDLNIGNGVDAKQDISNTGGNHPTGVEKVTLPANQISNTGGNQPTNAEKVTLPTNQISNTGGNQPTNAEKVTLPANQISNTGGNQPTNAEKVTLPTNQISNTGGNQPTNVEKVALPANNISNTGGNQPTDVDKVRLVQLTSDMKDKLNSQFAREKANLSNEQNYPTTAQKLIELELGQLPEPEFKQRVQNIISQRMDKQKKFNSVSIEGRILLPSKAQLPTQTLLPSRVLLPPGILAPSRANFSIKQLSPPILEQFIIQAQLPDGRVLPPVQANAEGHYRLTGIPSGMRVLLFARHPNLNAQQALAYLDIAPVSENKTLQQEISPQTTAIARLLRSVQNTVELRADRLSIQQFSTQFKQQVDELKPWIELYFNQPVLESLSQANHDKNITQFIQDNQPQLIRTIRQQALNIKQGLLNLSNRELRAHIITSPLSFALPPSTGSELSNIDESISRMKFLSPFPGQVAFQGETIAIELEVLNPSTDLIKTIEVFINDNPVDSLNWDQSSLQVQRGIIKTSWNSVLYAPGTYQLKSIAKAQNGTILFESQTQWVTLKQGEKK